jgi:uncharacterized Ntn-hydrolase superfamily protein
VEDLTFSIVALDPRNSYFGVGVASGSIAVGNRVPWAAYPIGAVATQAYTNPALGPLILNYMRKGYSAMKALQKSLHEDREPSKRQLAVIDFKGEVALYTGADAPGEKGEARGEYCGSVANLVVDSIIPSLMCRVFMEEYPVHGLIWAILTSLEEAEDLGGDKRGDHSAAILVAGKTEYGSLYDRILDLRVDYDPEGKAVARLKEIIESYYS